MTNCEIDVHLWIVNPDDRHGMPLFVCRNCGKESVPVMPDDTETVAETALAIVACRTRERLAVAAEAVQTDYVDDVPTRPILETCDDGFGEGGYILNVAALTDPSAARNDEAEAPWKFFLYPDDLRRLKAILAAVTI